MRLTRPQYVRIIAHCLDGYPYEACGMLGGPLGADLQPTGEITEVYCCRNADESGRTYTVDSRDLLAAMRGAEAAGGDVVGVFHSHTHTDAWPSATDVRQAVDPRWFYVLVSLRHADPVLRSFRIVDGEIIEVPVEVPDLDA